MRSWPGPERANPEWARKGEKKKKRRPLDTEQDQIKGRGRKRLNQPTTTIPRLNLCLLTETRTGPNAPVGQRPRA